MPTETRKYLDDTGVALLWAKVKLAIAAKPDVNTTYTLSQNSQDGHQFTLTGSDGYSATITIPDNFDSTAQTKLSGIEAGAEVNVQANWNEADTTADSYIQNKPTIPTAVSQLTNDSNYQTDTQVTTAINTAIAQISTIDFVVVASYQDLPVTGVKGTFYLVPHTPGTHDIYDEYIWTVTDDTTTPPTYGYELIGTTSVDLTDYMKISDWNNDVYMTPITSTEIDNICV